MQGRRSFEHHRQPRSPRIHPSPKSPLSPVSNSRPYGLHPPSPPVAVVNVRGHTLIAPNSTLARAVVMGNQESAYSHAGGPHDRKDFTDYRVHSHPDARTAVHSSMRNDTLQDAIRPVSNLTVLLNQQQNASSNANELTRVVAHEVAEADSASGPSYMVPLGRSAPDFDSRPLPPQFIRQWSTAATQLTEDKVRRCMSSKELGTLAPPSGSPYAQFLSRKVEIETATRKKLLEMRQAEANLQWHRSLVPHSADSNDPSSSGSSRAQHECTNEVRNRRRAEHAKAVVDDLCDVVADLFLAESKLLDPRNYGVQTATRKVMDRAQIIPIIRAFVSSLPVRYALGADTPSEVLLHMRLMAAARADQTKVALHVHNLDDDNNWTHTIMAQTTRLPNRSGQQRSLRLVTISCHDCTGLLEYISRLLASSGSRVLDADVMLSTDGIVLDRFVVEMAGRLRLAKIVNLVESFLRDALAQGDKKSSQEESSPSSSGTRSSSTKNLEVVPEIGPLYFVPDASQSRNCQHEQEILQAIPLSEMLSSRSFGSLGEDNNFPKLRKMHSMPAVPSTIPHSPLNPASQPLRKTLRNAVSKIPIEVYTGGDSQNPQPPPRSMRERRPLTNRRGSSDLDQPTVDSVDDLHVMDYLTVPGAVSPSGSFTETRVVPLIPFDELMLIESIGTGRVSTIYRAAWRRNQSASNYIAGNGAVQMVALKVAMVNPSNGDTSHVDELRREADIAARLQHPNICDLVGVAADPECFCLAYEYCEGGSLLSLLSDHTRYYEYLPIALDIAQGMAFLHKKSIIHRDLKPANILLTRDHRAKIADFGMSISNYGQELTAETGTYRYMAPEVIRHESYSSNADVYSFGICLWQLITREIPFATMTPIQAAYAVAEGRRPEIPASTPLRLQEIIRSCWDQDSQRRPSFTYVAMALADYVKMAFSPANVGTLTLQIANEMLATVEGNSTVNVDFSTPVAGAFLPPPPPPAPANYFNLDYSTNDSSGNLGLEIE